ncbi:hypothetical protein ScPMuIL_006943 [Solemya velum]
MPSSLPQGLSCSHLIFVIWGSVEILLFAGTIFGWHSLVYVFKEDGYFRDLCPQISNTSEEILHRNQTNVYKYSSVVNRSENSYNLSHSTSPSDEIENGAYAGPCKPQDKEFNLIFSLATVVTGLMSVFNGVMYDRFGTRFCRTIAVICYLAGMFCFIFASPAHSLWLYPGAVLIVYGGYMILITNLQLAGLIPRLRSTLMSLYAGSYDCSAVIFLLFKATYEGGVSTNTCFTMQAA